MIAAHQFDTRRRRYFAGVVHRWWVIAAAVMGVLAFVLQCVAVYYAVKGHQTVIVRTGR